MANKQSKKEVKKQDRLAEWLWHDHLIREARLRDLMTEFYLDLEPAEFVDGSQAGKSVIDTCVLKRFSEDEEARYRCVEITKDAELHTLESMDIDFNGNLFTFQGIACGECFFRIKFRVNQEDAPVFVSEGFTDDTIIPRFLVDSDYGEVFMTVSDIKDRNVNWADDFEEFADANSSYVKLWEFHAVILGIDVDSDNTFRPHRCFMASYTQDPKRSNDASCRFITDEIYAWDSSPVKEILENIFPKDVLNALDNKTSHVTENKDNEVATEDSSNNDVVTEAKGNE